MERVEKFRIVKEGLVLITPEGGIEISDFEFKNGTLEDLRFVVLERFKLAWRNLRDDRDTGYIGNWCK